MKKILSIFGTRPEAIKMAPVIKELQKNSNSFISHVCVTGQHREMLDSVLEIFDILPDYDLNIMKPGQDLYDVTCNVISGLKAVLQNFQPDLVMVHGDTATAMASSLAAYYSHTPVAHVEAGLRTSDKYSPFPEEINRRIVSVISDHHFAPTSNAKTNLLKEGIPANQIFITGNTVIDALHISVNKIKSEPEIVNLLMKQFFFLNNARRMILVTGHRRENFGKGFDNICNALVNIATIRKDIDIVYPVHLNPRVKDSVNRILAKSGCSNIYLLDPVDYIPFVYLMMRCSMVLTDSGGVQEEAPSLNKPVLVMRDNTERPEGVDSGALKVVGTSTKNIVNETLSLLDDNDKYKFMQEAINPYGDGMAAKKIVQIISKNIFYV